MIKKITYEDDPWKDDPPGFLMPISDFLPSPAELAKAMRTTKVTIALSEDSLAFFKKQAKKHKTQYQKMIRAALDHYVRESEQRT